MTCCSPPQAEEETTPEKAELAKENGHSLHGAPARTDMDRAPPKRWPAVMNGFCCWDASSSAVNEAVSTDWSRQTFGLEEVTAISEARPEGRCRGFDDCFPLYQGAKTVQVSQAPAPGGAGTDRGSCCHTLFLFAPMCDGAEPHVDDDGAAGSLGVGLSDVERIAEIGHFRLPNALGEDRAKVSKDDADYQELFLDDGCYKGQVRDDDFNGWGQWRSTSVTAEGYWKDGRLNGSGQKTWSDGRMYAGQFVDGTFHGYGRMQWRHPQGAMVYEGQYVSDKKHGSGKFTWPSGQVYDGQWVEGRRSGIGAETLLDRTTTIGRWEDNVFVRKAEPDEERSWSPAKQGPLPEGLLPA